MTLPLSIKVGNDDYIKKRIVAYVIDRVEDLFLCQLKTLKEWKTVVFYKRKETDLIEIK